MSERDEQLWADVAVKMGQWKQTGRDAGPHDIAPFVDDIIAMVRQSERRAIREALLSEEAVEAAAKGSHGASPWQDQPFMSGGYWTKESTAAVSAALSAVGLSDESEGE